MLEKELEWSLARRWREDQDADALDQLTRSYLRLVLANASKFKNYGLPLADLVQEGCVGLLQAASRFETERKLRFATYASWWIRAAIQDYVLRNWSIVRTGTTSAHKTLFFNLRRLRAKIVGTVDRPLDLAEREEIATTLGVPARDVLAMEGRMTGGDRSLNVRVGEDGDSEWQDFIASEAAGPDQTVEAHHDNEARANVLRNAMAHLTDRETLIIRARQMADKSATLSSLGEKLGVSKERVRQIEAQALGKLRSAVLRQTPNPVAAGLI